MLLTAQINPGRQRVLQQPRSVFGFWTIYANLDLNVAGDAMENDFFGRCGSISQEKLEKLSGFKCLVIPLA